MQIKVWRCQAAIGWTSSSSQRIGSWRTDQLIRPENDDSFSCCVLATPIQGITLFYSGVQCFHDIEHLFWLIKVSQSNIQEQLTCVERCIKDFFYCRIRKLTIVIGLYAYFNLIYVPTASSQVFTTNTYL